jgi:ribosomal protein S30
MVNHGSLARAGKVKNQTPRMECLMGRERKNKLKRRGRARKRKLYKAHKVRLGIMD